MLLWLANDAINDNTNIWQSNFNENYLKINRSFLSPFGGLSNPSEAELAFASNKYQSSVCWRGYFATWELIDDKLHLVALSNQFIVQEDEEPIENQLGYLYRTNVSSVANLSNFLHSDF